LVSSNVLIATKRPPLNLIRKLNQQVSLRRAPLQYYRRLNGHGR
jgi:hypothetical protein